MLLSFLFSASHKPASGLQDLNAVSAEKRTWGITMEISFLGYAYRCKIKKYIYKKKKYLY